MSGETVAIIERIYKAAILVPVLAVTGWWVVTNWMEGTLQLRQAVIALALLAAAFSIGVVWIASGGWSFLSLLVVIYAALVGFAVWGYTAVRNCERSQLLEQVDACRETLEADPGNGGAWSYLGEAYLRLRRFEEAQEALERALELDPESRRDRALLQQARERRPWGRGPRLE